MKRTVEGRRSRWTRLRDALAYRMVLGLGIALRLLPRRGAVAAGRVGGGIAYFLLRHDRKVAHANLNLVLGSSVASAEKRRIVRGTFGRVGQNMAGLLWSPRLTAGGLAALVESEELITVLAELRRRQQGVILATAHYGDWELLTYAAGLLDVPVLAVAEPMTNAPVSELLTRLREGSGNRLIPPRFALLKSFRALRQGKRVAVMVDVNGRRGRGGVWLNFFGLPVFNGIAMADLAVRTRSAVVFVAAKPLPGGKMRIVCRAPIEPLASLDRETAIQNLSQQVLDQCADLIRDDPTPWLWTYKRWKRRPSPERASYPFYSKHSPSK